MSSVQLAKYLVFHACTKHIEVHYHFVRDRVLNGEVELWYVRTDQQGFDIFTKALETDKLQHFSEMLGLQYLDMPHLRGRKEEETKTEIGITCKSTRQAAGEDEKTKTRGDKDEYKADLTEGVCKSEHVRIRDYDNNVKNDRADGKKKAKTLDHVHVVKGLKVKDELETTNSDKSGNKSLIIDLLKVFDSDEPKQLKAK